MKLFSLWCAWKEDTKTTLNTATSSPWVLWEVLQLGTNLRQLPAQTCWCESWLTLKAAILPHDQTSKDCFLLQLPIHPPPQFCKDAHRLRANSTTSFHIGRQSILPHVQICTPTSLRIHWNMKRVRNTSWTSCCYVTLCYYSCKSKFLSKFCPLTVNLA